MGVGARLSWSVGPRRASCGGALALVLVAGVTAARANDNPPVDGRGVYSPLYSGAYWDAQGVQLSLAGFNLLHDHHQEYAGGSVTPRYLLVGLQWQY